MKATTVLPVVAVLALAARIVSAQSLPVSLQVDTSHALRFERTLHGLADRYAFDLSLSRNVEIGIAIPDGPGAKNDVSAALLKQDDLVHPIAILEANDAPWSPVFTDNSGNAYRRGPTLAAALPAGNYEVRIWSSNNDSRYLLTMGQENTQPAPSRSLSGNAGIWIVLGVALLALLMAYLMEHGPHHGTHHRKAHKTK